MRQRFPRNTFVAPVVGSSLKLAVGDAPGKEDSVLGEPFTGGTGKVFNVLTNKAGLDRDELAMCNTIQCRPPEDRYPTDPQARTFLPEHEGHAAVAHCYKNHVEPLLKSRPWQRVFLFGDKALKVITGKDSVNKWRGSPLPVTAIDPDKPLAIATLSPLQLMRDQSMYPVAINDLTKSLDTPPEYYNLFPSLDDVKGFTATEFAFDIETSREIDPETGKREVHMVALSHKPYHAIVVPFKGAYIPALQRIFSNARLVIGHNLIQFDLPELAKHGVFIPQDAEIADTMLMQHLRFPDLPHDLEFVASQFSSKPAWKHEKALFELYAARDVDVTLQCFNALKPMLRQAGQDKLYREVQVPLAKILRMMTEQGVKFDNTRLAQVREETLKEMDGLELKLPEQLRSYFITKKRRVLAPEGTISPKTKRPLKYIHEDYQEKVSPWNKDREKKALLYDQWGLPVQLHPKSGKPTVDKIALDKLSRRLKAPSSEFYNPERAEQLDALKKLSKKGHLLSGFAKEERVKLTRIYPSYNLHGTSSGRLSSSGDYGNLQNWPEVVRYLVVPSEPDWEIAEVDFSNIENRLVAWFANDTVRLRRYDDPKHNDYKLLASRAFGIPYEEVEKDNDREAPYGKAKAIVLGTNYGLGAIKTANMYDMDLAEVKKLMYVWKQEIKQTVAWQLEITKLAKKQGYLVTPFDRKRWFYTDTYYTESLSFLPQSTAADIIFRAMLALYYDRIGWPLERVQPLVRVIEPLPQPARMLLQVHDALVFEYPKAMREQVLGTVKRVMEQAWPELREFNIPVGIAVGPSWGEVKSFKF